MNPWFDFAKSLILNQTKPVHETFHTCALNTQFVQPEQEEKPPGNAYIAQGAGTAVQETAANTSISSHSTLSTLLQESQSAGGQQAWARSSECSALE